MGIAEFLIARLDGDRYAERRSEYIDMVRAGVAGFIVFGGEVETLRAALAELRAEAPLPLLIASDLEQGLGQQVRGGTLFPPALAMGEADVPLGVLRAAWRQFAEEAAYVGITAILAPVLDVNTNPRNPIIATRAFSTNPARAAMLGAEMVRTLHSSGMLSCGKHYPGHGDTEVDSHLALPVLGKARAELEACELVPFVEAIRAGVDMIMVGHLAVPALDPSMTPATLSATIIRHLRGEMGFIGLVTTDAMDMGGLAGQGEDEAAIGAIEAGADIVLHPRDPMGLIARVGNRASGLLAGRLNALRRGLRGPSSLRPAFDQTLALQLTDAAIRVRGDASPQVPSEVVVVDDTGGGRGEIFIEGLRERMPGIRARRIGGPGEGAGRPSGDCIVAVFGAVRAYKGGTSPWVGEALDALGPSARVAVAFGPAELLRGLPAEAAGRRCEVVAWWGAPQAERAAARRILNAYV